MHKINGNTITSEWDSPEVSFRKNWSRNITSLQIQTEKGNFYTLSTKKGRKSVFWQEDDYILQIGSDISKMIARKIFKNIGKDNWLVLKVDTRTGKPSLDIINRRIKVD